MTHGLLAGGLDVLGGIDNHFACKEIYEDLENNRRPAGRSPKFLHADITELATEVLEEIFTLRSGDDQLVFVGCSPCQYWSQVNTSREKSTNSKSLLKHFQRFVEYFKPGYVIIENVPGFSKRSKQSGLAGFLKFLKTEGYAFDQGTHPLFLYGVPQKRARYLLVATRLSSSNRKPKMSLPPQDPLDGQFPEKMKLRYFLGKDNGFERIEAGERSEDTPLHWAAGLAEQNLRRIRKTPANGGSRSAWKDDPDLQIPAYEGKDHFFRDVYGRMSWDQPAPTITTRFSSLSNGRFGHPEEDRAISLREGATLQTFPRNFRFTPSFPEASRQIGNAVPPELARRIGQHLIKHYQVVKTQRPHG